jgi:hypothetical protein
MLLEMVLEGGPHDGLQRTCETYPRAECLLPAVSLTTPRNAIYRLSSTEVRGSVKPVLLHYRFVRCAESSIARSVAGVASKLS